MECLVTLTFNWCTVKIFAIFILFAIIIIKLGCRRIYCGHKNKFDEGYCRMPIKVYRLCCHAHLNWKYIMVYPIFFAYQMIFAQSYVLIYSFLHNLLILTDERVSNSKFKRWMNSLEFFSHKSIFYEFSKFAETKNFLGKFLNFLGKFLKICFLLIPFLRLLIGFNGFWQSRFVWV